MASAGQGLIARPLQTRAPVTAPVVNNVVARQQNVNTVQPVRRQIPQGTCAPVQIPTRPGAGACGARTSAREIYPPPSTSPVSTTVPVTAKPVEQRVSSVRRPTSDFSGRVQAQPLTVQSNHDSRFNELRVYIDEQVKSFKASPPETPAVTPSMVEDFDERLEGALTTAAQEQAQHIDEMRVALENRIDSAIQEMRLSQSEQLRVFRDELDIKLAQAEIHASQAGASAAAQAIAQHSPTDHRALANEASGREIEFAAFRQQHDDHADRVQANLNDHSALIERVDRDNMLIRQSFDSHVSNLRDTEAKCLQLEFALQSQAQAKGQAPELQPNVATREWVETYVGQVGTRIEHIEKYAEQTNRDLQNHVDESTNMLRQLSEAHANHQTATQEQLAEAHAKIKHATQHVQTSQQHVVGPCNQVNMDMVSNDLNVRKGLGDMGRSVDELNHKSTSVIDRLGKLAETKDGLRRELAAGSFEGVDKAATVRKVAKMSQSLSLRLDALMAHVTPAAAEVMEDSQGNKLDRMQGTAQTLTTRLEMLEKDGGLMDSKFSTLSEKATYMTDRVALLVQAKLDGATLHVGDYAKASLDSHSATMQSIHGTAESLTRRLDALETGLPETKKAEETNFSVLSEKAASLKSRLEMIEQAVR